MGINSGISFCHHTWNPWQGCTKISPGCKNCYMYRDKVRYGQDPTVVKRSADATFYMPIRTKKWKPLDRIFVCSWSDFFHIDADQWRVEAWDMMRLRKDVNFILITKRPENITQRLPFDWSDGYDHVWLLTTTENQTEYDARVAELMRVPAKVRGIIAEPLLGPVRIHTDHLDRLQWVIAGCESGGEGVRRHAKLDWFRALRDQAAQARIPFFLKQIEIGSEVQELAPLDGRVYAEYPVKVADE
ncbi:MAG: hypothetical protein AMXMBFR84_37720 [Candidatus Hydrogenedentota bacterium]